MVEFLDGDPDQPLITGRVYNAANRTPYPLPAKKTVSTIKSRSHKSASANELRFDDATGDEEIFLYVQKDLETRVLNDAREVIGRDRHETTDGATLEEVGSSGSQITLNDRSQINRFYDPSILGTILETSNAEQSRAFLVPSTPSFVSPTPTPRPPARCHASASTWLRLRSHDFSPTQSSHSFLPSAMLPGAP